MNSVLLWIGTILVIALTALFAVPHFVDWTHYRGVFEEEASRALGREVRVSGGLSVRLLPAPRATFEKVRVSDAIDSLGEQGGAPLLRTEKFTMGLAVGPLLTGSIEATEIELVKPELQLAIAADGRGNWQSLASALGALPVTRHERGLAAFRINDGTVVATGPNGRDLLRLGGFDGELLSPGAGGPLRLRGTVTVAGEKREVRLSATPADASWWRVKASMRGLNSGTSHQFDGRLSALTDIGRYDGELTARLPAGLSAVGARATAASARDRSEQAFELRARIEGDVSSLKLADLTFEFEREGQPQRLTGEAVIGWFDGVDVKTALATRWIDLDRVAGIADGTAPVEAARWISGLISGLVPADGRFNAQLTADSVTVGRETMTNLAMSVDSRQGRLTVEEFKADVPGGGRLEVDGQAPGDGTFSGSTRLRSASSDRFFAWATRGLDLPRLGIDGPLALQAKFLVTATSARLTNVDLEMAGFAMRGSAMHDWRTRPRTEVEITADELDLTGPLRGLLGAPLARAVFAPVWNRAAGPGAGGSSDADAARPRWYDPTTSDLVMRFDVGLVRDGAIALRDLDGGMSALGGAISFDRLKFKTPSGARVVLDGAVPATGTPRRGSLTVDLEAASRAAVAELLELVGYPAVDVDLEPLLPARLSGRLQHADRGPARTQLTIDGSLKESRAYLRVSASGADPQWDRVPLDVAVALVGPQAGALADLVAPGRPGRRQIEARPTDQLSIRLVGTPAKGLLAQAGVRLPGAELAFDGKLTGLAEGPPDWSLKGRVGIGEAELGDVLSRLGIGGFGKRTTIPVAGQVDIDAGPDRIMLDLGAVEVDGARASGKIAVMAGEAGSVFEAELAAPDASLQKLLAGLTSPEPRGEVSASDTSFWPQSAFELDRLRTASGKIRLTTERLDVAPGLSVEAAAIAATLGPTGIDITELSGRALGGTLSSKWRLEPSRSDAILTGEMKLSGTQLSAVAGRDAGGSASAVLSISGRGPTPALLAQLATGRGHIDLTDARFAGVETKVAAIAAERHMAADLDSAPPDVAATIREVSSRGRVDIGSRRLELELTQGSIRVAPLVLAAPDADASAEVTIDTLLMQAEAEWRFVSKSRESLAGKPSRPLPAVTILRTGPLVELLAGKVEPSVRADDFARDVSLRRLERATQELERLRKLDEERARLEAERRRASEEARALQALPASPAPVAPPAPSPVQPGAVPPSAVPGETNAPPVRKPPTAGSSGLGAARAGTGGSGFASP